MKKRLLNYVSDLLSCFVPYVFSCFMCLAPYVLSRAIRTLSPTCYRASCALCYMCPRA